MHHVTSSRKPAATATAAPKPPPGRHPDFDVEAALHDMPDTFIQCRDFNHSWRPFTAQLLQAERAYEVTLRCARCKTRRVRLMGLDGGLVSSNYEYADGYVIKGMGRITGLERNALRLESVRRILPAEGA